MRGSGRIGLARPALAVGALLLSLALVEIVLRTLDWPAEDPVWASCRETAFQFAPRLDYRHMSTEFDVSFQTNSLGLRDDEVGPKRGTRILLLGDSYTCGYGVQRGELFADLLERQIQLEVINAGVGGFELVHQLHYFRTRGRKLRPDLVVLALYLNNDLTGNRIWQSYDDGSLGRRDGKPALDTQGTAKLICLARQFVPLRRVVHGLRRCYCRLPAALPGERYLALCADPLGDDAEQDYQTALQLIGQLRDEVHAAGAEFLVASFPLRAVVEEECPQRYFPPDGSDGVSYDLLRPVTIFGKRLQTIGIHHLPLTEWLRLSRRQLGAPLYFHNDGHLNPAGHRCLAEGLASKLELSSNLLRNAGVEIAGFMPERQLPSSLYRKTFEEKGQVHFAPKTPQNEPVPDGFGVDCQLLHYRVNFNGR